MKQRIINLVLLLAASWIVMTFTHESGHIIGGLACGATLTDYDLVPWRMPYSLHSPDPHPLITLWSGPLFGVAAPMGLAALIRKRWVWFIADFCLLANGCYLALAWVAGDRLLDTPRLLEAGANPASIVLYCVLSIGVGYTWFRSDCIYFLMPAGGGSAGGGSAGGGSAGGGSAGGGSAGGLGKGTNGS